MGSDQRTRAVFRCMCFSDCENKLGYFIEFGITYCNSFTAHLTHINHSTKPEDDFIRNQNIEPNKNIKVSVG